MMAQMAKKDVSIGDMFLFENNTMGIEEECIVTAVHPWHLELITKDGIVLNALQGFNEQQFIPIIELD